MNVEILLLAVLVGMTVLAYMVAINAHGPTRLSLSYLMATVMLAGTVWAIVQYVNTGIESLKTAEIKKLQYEKNAAEAQVLTQADSLRQNRTRLNFAGRLNTVLSAATACATSMLNNDFQDRNSSLDILMARANETKRKTEVIKAQFDSVKTEDPVFNEANGLIKEGVQALSEAAYYYKSYYYSEDGEQEQEREKIIRSKARVACDKFQKASSLIASPL
jgi:hypothetical protein